MTDAELIERLRGDGETCPFCGHDPYHYVDNGVGMERVAVNCCDLGNALIQHQDELLQKEMALRNEAADRLLALSRECEGLREALKPLAEIADEYTEWAGDEEGEHITLGDWDCEHRITIGQCRIARTASATRPLQEDEGMGVSPASQGPGSRERNPQAVSAPDAWRTDKLPFDQRPIYQFVLLEGYHEHSGQRWHRRFAGTAVIDESGWDRFGYRAADIDRIQRDGDMDVAERVVGWTPAVWPRWDFDAQADGSPQGGNAERGSIAEGDDSPVREADAPGPHPPHPTSVDTSLAGELDPVPHHASGPTAGSVREMLVTEFEWKIDEQQTRNEASNKVGCVHVPMDLARRILSALRQPPQAGVDRDAVLSILETALARSNDEPDLRISLLKCGVQDAIRALKTTAPTVSLTPPPRCEICGTAAPKEFAPTSCNRPECKYRGTVSLVSEEVVERVARAIRDARMDWADLGAQTERFPVDNYDRQLARAAIAALTPTGEV